MKCYRIKIKKRKTSENLRAWVSWKPPPLREQTYGNYPGQGAGTPLSPAGLLETRSFTPVWRETHWPLSQNPCLRVELLLGVARVVNDAARSDACVTCMSKENICGQIFGGFFTNGGLSTVATDAFLWFYPTENSWDHSASAPAPLVC